MLPADDARRNVAAEKLGELIDLVAAEMYEEIVDVILELDNLTQFELVRFHSLEPGGKVHLEVLYGYGARWLETRVLTGQGLAKYPSLPSSDCLLIHCDAEYFDAAPYLWSRQDGKGQTEILVLRGYKENPAATLYYDVPGQIETMPFAGGNPNPNTSCLAALFN